MKSFGRERAEHRLTTWLRETKACEALDLRGLYMKLFVVLINTTTLHFHSCQMEDVSMCLGLGI